MNEPKKQRTCIWPEDQAAHMRGGQMLPDKFLSGWIGVLATEHTRYSGTAFNSVFTA